MRRLRFLILIALALAGMAQSTRRPGMSYAVETPPNLVRLVIPRIRGKAMDRMGMAIPRVALGLYTEKAPHQLLAASTSGEDGKFDFGNQIADGQYRLIAQYPGLCTANIPLQVDHHARGKHIELRMEYPGLDVCSYARLH